MADPMMDPRAMGLLGMASGLFQAGGVPQRGQRPISLGQALGSGMQQGMLSYQMAAKMQQDAQEAQAMQQYRQMQMAQMQEEMRRQKEAAEAEQKWRSSLPPEMQQLMQVPGFAKSYGEGLGKAMTTTPEHKPLTRTIKRDDQEITQEYDYKKGGWTDVATAPRWNPNAQPAAVVHVDTTGTSQKAFFKGLGEKEAAKFSEQQQLAEDAATSLRGIGEARKLLAGGMITGFGADFRVGFGKALQQLGINYNPDAIANSEAFAAAQAKQVAQIIKAFGAGTGLSDADREFAMAAAGGKITMNEASINRILDINERASRTIIQNFNRKASQIPSETLPYPLSVEEPPIQKMRSKSGKPMIYRNGQWEYE